MHSALPLSLPLSLPPSLLGADPFVKDREGKSPLDLVMMSGNIASIQALSRAMKTQLVRPCPPSLSPSLPLFFGSSSYFCVPVHHTPSFPPSLPPSLPNSTYPPFSSFLPSQVAFMGLALLFFLYRRGGDPQQVPIPPLPPSIWPLFDQDTYPSLPPSLPLSLP